MREAIAALFQTVVQLSLVGSYVILVVLLVRLLLRKAPGWCSYLLWGIVFLRLCCPVFPEMEFSLIPSVLVTGEGLMAERNEKQGESGDLQITDNDNADSIYGQSGNTAFHVGNKQEIEGIQEFEANQSADNQSQNANSTLQNTGNQLQNIGDKPGLVSQQDVGGELLNEGVIQDSVPYLALLWLAGMLLCMGYHIYSYWSLKRRVRNTKEVEPGVREIEGLHLSFVMGIFRPVIYLSSGLDEESRRVVLCHEQVHLKRRDYLTKPIALGICCIHWFNPLVWLAFYLMNKDCEMSCDERVVNLLGEDSKKIYSYALLDEATGGESKAYRKGSVCALLSFGEDHVKNRVKHVLQYHKASVWMIAGAVVILAALLVGLCSNPGKEPQTGQEQSKTDENPEEINSSKPDNAKEFAKISEEQRKYQTSPESALGHFATAYMDRDGDALYELCLDKENFENWDMVTVLKEGNSGSKYAFGESSPWVYDYNISFKVGSEEAKILFILTDSVPEYYIAEEKVRLVKQDELYYVDHMAYKLYDEIASRDELAQIFDLKAEHPFGNADTGYSNTFAGTIFYHILKGTNPGYYDAYRNPVSAARKLLHLGEGTGEVTEVLYEPARPYNFGYSGDGSLYGEGTVVNVHYTFAKDGSEVDIPMVMSEQSKGVWMLSVGDLTKASEQEIGPLPGENAKVIYGEYADYDEDGIWSRENIGSYPDKGVAYQISSYGVYRLAGEYECIYPQYIHMDESVTVDFYEGKMYFPTDSLYVGGANDFMYDSICELNLTTEEYHYIRLSSNATTVFPLSWFSVSDGIIRLYGKNSSGSGYALLLEDAEPVWQEKTATELAEEERAAYGVSLRNSILQKANTVVSVGNRTADNTFALIDMDGDGSTEEITLTPLDDGSQGYGPLDHYKLQCGGGFEERYGENMCNDIFAFSPDGERIFIALYEDGPSGDPLTTIFKYEYNRLYEAGEIASDIRKWDMENGIIDTVIGNWAVQTDYIKVQYRMNDQGNVELVPQESYQYTDKGGDIWDALKVSLPLHTSPDSEESFLLEPCKVRFLAVHNSWEWVLVETQDGLQGWMHIVDMKVVELDMWTTDVFDGLSMAG